MRRECERITLQKRFFILSNNIEGLYRFRFELIEQLSNDYKIIIIAPNESYKQYFDETKIEFINVKIDRRGMNIFKDILLLLNYFFLSIKYKPSFALTYTIKPNIYGGLVFRFLRIKYFPNITGVGSSFQKKGIFSRTVIFLYRLALKKAVLVFFENNSNMQSFVSFKIVRNDKCFTLNGAGVNLTRFPYVPFPKISHDIFLFIGRIMFEKGIVEYIEVAERIKKKNSNIQFFVIGPYEDNMLSLIEKCHKKGIINYLGYIPDVRPYLAMSTCFVLPSYHEGMANTILEACSCGRPIIASDIPGCREAVFNEQNGFLVKAKSIDSLEKSIERFISLSYEQKESMSYKSRYIAETVFDKQAVVNETIRLIKEKL